MIREALDAYARASARTFEDRHLTIGASEIGSCARRIFWTKMEGDPVYGAARDPEYQDGWGAARRGATFEDHFWVPAMRRAFGAKLLYSGDQQQTLVSEFLSATPDGLLIGLPRAALAALGVLDIGLSGELVVECKTADPRTRLDQAKPEHVFQAQVQLGLLRELTPHRPNFALISYADASFWDNVIEFVVAFDPATYATAKVRARNIMLARSAAELPPEGWIAGGSECRYCPFTQVCGRARKAAEADPQFVAEVGDLARANARGGSTFLGLRRSG